MDQIQIRLLINVFCPDDLYVEGVQVFEFLNSVAYITDISPHLSRGITLLKRGLKVMKFIFKNVIKY